MAFAEDDPLTPRLESARRQVAEAAAALDSLALEIARRPAPVAGAAPAISPEDSAIWREVRAEKRRRAELAEAFGYRRVGAGYIFNPNLPFGMNVLAWRGDWGLKLDGRMALAETRRDVGANLSLLYAVHEFYLTGEQMLTRLYLFGGGGYYWERRYDGSGNWYDTPDRAFRVQLGAGTELGVREAHGTRFTPEIGFQGSRFISRFNDSPDYPGDRPRSDFSLYPYYAFHINFYFL